MTGKTTLNAGNLRAGYSEREIVKSVSCSFTAGTFTGIIGPNGSGKTTLLKAFSRVLPSSGLLELAGKPVADFTPAELGMALGFVPQDESRPFSYTVMQVVLMARYARTSRFTSLTPADYARCHTVLEETGISHLQDRSIQALSGGEWQRVLIARALAQDTKMLLLDEPTSHLDLTHQSDALSLMKGLAGTGSTIIGVFHDLNLAALFCDRLIMIKEGMLVADGTPAKVLTPEKIRDVYGADVVASCHPATGRTFLMPLSTRSCKTPDGRETPLRVLVVSGGGSGADLLHLLAGRGYDLSAGVLATTDTDYGVAKALGIPSIPILPFSQITAHALEKLRGMANRADRIILPAHPVSAGNLPVLSVLRESDPAKVIVHLPAGREFASYDFAKGAAAAAMTDLCTAGASCTPTYDGIITFLEQPVTPASKLSE